MWEDPDLKQKLKLATGEGFIHSDSSIFFYFLGLFIILLMIIKQQTSNSLRASIFSILKHFVYPFDFLNMKIYHTFFFSARTTSILLYPYLEKSITYFFFCSSSPNKDPNCFFNISKLLREPDEGKLIDLMLSSPLFTKTGFVWSNWLAVLFFFSVWNLYWK